MSSGRRNIGSILTSRMLGLQEAVAGGTGDATELDSASFDRRSTQLLLSCKAIVAVEATLASGATLTVVANMQDSVDDSVWVDHGAVFASAVVLTGPSGGGEVRGVAEFDVELSNANRYVRMQSTQTHSATGTDTSVSASVLVLGGGDEVPAS